MIQHIFYLLGTALRIYMFICIIRIFLSWIPAFIMSGFGYFLCEICDPYLNRFKSLRFSRIGAIDFSPVLALGLLTVLYRLCFSIASTGAFSLIGLTKGIILMLWSFFSFLLGIFIVISLLRFILDFSETYRYHTFIQSIDTFLTPATLKIQNLFFRGKPFAYRKSIFLLFLILSVLRLSLGFLIYFLLRLF